MKIYIVVEADEYDGNANIEGFYCEEKAEELQQLLTSKIKSYDVGRYYYFIDSVEVNNG